MDLPTDMCSPEELVELVRGQFYRKTAQQESESCELPVNSTTIDDTPEEERKDNLRGLTQITLAKMVIANKKITNIPERGIFVVESSRWYTKRE